MVPKKSARSHTSIAVPSFRLVMPVSIAQDKLRSAQDERKCLNLRVVTLEPRNDENYAWSARLALPLRSLARQALHSRIIAPSVSTAIAVVMWAMLDLTKEIFSEFNLCQFAEA